MRNKLLFVLAGVGVLLGLMGAWYFGVRQPPQPPVFNPAQNPYKQGIYANGIIESAQGSGENVNIFPEVAGPVTKILVAEGQTVRAGTPLLIIDYAVQQATTIALKAQADAAGTLLEELKKQPRPEAFEVAKAQAESADASVRQASDQLAKQSESYRMDPRSVSKDALDTAQNTLRIAQANLAVARRQYDLTKAGAWVYDIRNQEKLYQSLEKQYEAANELLQKFTVRAPVDGIVMALQTSMGNYVSSQGGAYQSYTQASGPMIVMSNDQQFLGVRVYVDEILVHRLPKPENLTAQMQIRGTDVKIPLEFVRVQPYVSPKIELSDERQERVDLRVLPVLFRFRKPANLNLYPGQLVDVYINGT